MSTKRIYIAIPVGNVLDKDAPKRLVNGGSPAAVRLYVTKNLYEIRLATTHEVAQYVGGGTKVEEIAEATLPGVPAA